MGYTTSDFTRAHDEEAGEELVSSERPIAPGKRTLTMSLPRPAAAPVQQRMRRPAAAAPRAVQALTARWMDVAMRPDLHAAPDDGAVQAMSRGGEPAPAGEAEIHAAAQHGTSGSAGSLPYLEQIQRSFGRHDVTGVRAYTDGNAQAGARAMGAEAFATGDRVAFGGAASLHTAAHEAAHVVQQRAGVHLKGGVGAAGDRYERQADAVADLVVQGRSAEALLDEASGMTGPGAGGAVQRRAAAGSAANAVVQRKIDLATLESKRREAEQSGGSYTGTLDEDTDWKTANAVGAEWAQEGAKRSMYGPPFKFQLLSADRKYQYRPPMVKKSGKKVGAAQANYEWRPEEGGDFTFNAHVTVTDIDSYSGEEGGKKEENKE